MTTVAVCKACGHVVIVGRKRAWCSHDCPRPSHYTVPPHATVVDVPVYARRGPRP